MIYAQVKCKVVTPIISRKDPQTGEFDLTGQSIKGVLHFWFRAVAPRIIDIYRLNEDNKPKSPKENKELYELYKTYEKEKYAGLKLLENEIFGSQKKKAPFGVWVEYNKDDLRIYNSENKNRNNTDENKNRKNTDENNGSIKSNGAFKYALYGIKKAKYLDVDSLFTLHFTFENKNIQNVISSLLKLTSLVGGIGAKTTKGFGRFEIIQNEEEKSNKSVNERIEDVLNEAERSIKEFIESKEILNTQKKLKDILIYATQTELLDFPNLCKGSYLLKDTKIKAADLSSVISKIYEKQKYTESYSIGWYRQLKYVIRHNGELKKSKDSLIKLAEVLKGRSKEPVEIPVAFLGLPLQYSFGNVSVKINQDAGEKKEDIRITRKPSCLRILLFRDRDGKYFVNALLLKSHISPRIEKGNGYKLSIVPTKSKKENNEKPEKKEAYLSADWEKLSEFITKFEK
jgi:CRISPR-associated protein Cmr1